MAGTITYHREEALRFRINAFLRDAFGLPEADYYARLDIKSLLRVKAALSDINNALTLRLTLKFVTWIQAALQLDDEARATVLASVLSVKPSTNGFDVSYLAGPMPFIAEVKCNIPINGGSKYGAAQSAGVLKDVKALREGKSKASSVASSALRFMVFPDLPEVRSANAHLFNSNSSTMRFLTDGEQPSDPGVVYGVYLPIDA